MDKDYKLKLLLDGVLSDTLKNLKKVYFLCQTEVKDKGEGDDLFIKTLEKAFDFCSLDLVIGNNGKNKLSLIIINTVYDILKQSWNTRELEFKLMNFLYNNLSIGYLGKELLINPIMIHILGKQSNVNIAIYFLNNFPYYLGDVIGTSLIWGYHDIWKWNEDHNELTFIEPRKVEQPHIKVFRSIFLQWVEKYKDKSFFRNVYSTNYEFKNEYSEGNRGALLVFSPKDMFEKSVESIVEGIENEEIDAEYLVTDLEELYKKIPGQNDNQDKRNAIAYRLIYVLLKLIGIGREKERCITIIQKINPYPIKYTSVLLSEVLIGKFKLNTMGLYTVFDILSNIKDCYTYTDYEFSIIQKYIWEKVKSDKEFFLFNQEGRLHLQGINRTLFNKFIFPKVAEEGFPLRVPDDEEELSLAFEELLCFLSTSLTNYELYTEELAGDIVRYTRDITSAITKNNAWATFGKNLRLHMYGTLSKLTDKGKLKVYVELLYPYFLNKNIEVIEPNKLFEDNQNRELIPGGKKADNIEILMKYIERNISTHKGRFNLIMVKKFVEKYY